MYTTIATIATVFNPNTPTDLRHLGNRLTSIDGLAEKCPELEVLDVARNPGITPDALFGEIVKIEALVRWSGGDPVKVPLSSHPFGSIIIIIIIILGWGVWG